MRQIGPYTLEAASLGIREDAAGVALRSFSMGRIWYKALAKYLSGLMWQQRPEYLERLIARCRKGVKRYGS